MEGSAPTPQIRGLCPRRSRGMRLRRDVPPDRTRPGNRIGSKAGLRGDSGPRNQRVGHIFRRKAGTLIVLGILTVLGLTALGWYVSSKNNGLRSIGNGAEPNKEPDNLPPKLALKSVFRAGTYKGPSVLGGQASITISGPAVLADGGETWSLAASPSAPTCTYPSAAIWYVGPIGKNPVSARLKAAGITSVAWSYGIGNAQCASMAHWYNNTLIGVTQIGNTLTIVSFTRNGADYSVPVDQVTFTQR